ncbi:hypothetical protein P3C58_22680 [Mesorhizobium sp. XAP10]|uniref:hypothetical protein n=1 Tax=unclassified Mesorhizobium TaxID=325217 RepID=UPI0023DF28C0|nr:MULTISPECIES: hypothetical protein [unclassified Mesorhizobium]MDF3154789.1 hypothetical protein [Mesorhizobium sp. XAP10]MDF3247661.1 hypothetical protein [Mesorhizobium sp. XAP4]
MSAPVIAQLRPMTIDEMVPGEVYDPGYSIFVIETLPVFGASGREKFGFQCQVWLPPEHREPTVANTKIAMGVLRNIDPNARKMIGKIAALSRDPRSRREAVRIGMREEYIPPDRAAPFLSRSQLRASPAG